jgi:hypothetical protein
MHFKAQDPDGVGEALSQSGLLKHSDAIEGTSF